MGGTEHDHMTYELAATTNNAEQMIAQRLDELRVAAFGPVEPATGGDSGVESGARGTATSDAWDLSSRDESQLPPAALRPTGGEHTFAISRPQSAELDATTALSSRIIDLQDTLHEDLARVEVMLRSWGDPSDASRQLARQVGAAISQLEQALQPALSRMATQLERASSQPNPGAVLAQSQERLLGTLARWMVQLEQSSTTAGAATTDELVKLARSVDAIARDLAKVSSTSADELPTSARLDALDTTLVDIGVRVDKHHNHASTLVRQVAEDIHASIDGQSEDLQTILQRQQHLLRRQLDEIDGASQRQFTELTSKVQRTSELMRDDMERMRRDVGDVVSIRLQPMLDEQIAELHATIESTSAEARTENRALATRQEDVMRDLIGLVRAHQKQVDVAISDLASQVEKSQASMTQMLVESMSTVVAAIDALRERQHRDAQVSRDTVRAEAAGLRNDFLAEFARTDAQQTDDMETIVDTFTRGFAATTEELARLDRRLLHLSARTSE